MTDVLAKLWRVDWQEAVRDYHWVHAELVCHEVQRVDFLVSGFHRVADWGKGDLYKTQELLH